MGGGVVGAGVEGGCDVGCAVGCGFDCDVGCDIPCPDELEVGWFVGFPEDAGCCDDLPDVVVERGVPLLCTVAPDVLLEL